MAILNIGQNAQTLASKSALNQVAGAKIAAVLSALREANDLKLLLDQIANADLVTLGFGDGTNGTANEVGYLKTALACAADLYGIMNGVAAVNQLPFNYASNLRYCAAID